MGAHPTKLGLFVARIGSAYGLLYGTYACRSMQLFIGQTFADFVGAQAMCEVHEPADGFMRGRDMSY